MRHLPPKPIISNRLTDGRVGLQIKRLVQHNPKISIREIESRLKKLFGDVADGAAPLPSRTSISEFLQRNQLVVFKLLKNPLLRDINKEKRLKFAQEAVRTSDLLNTLINATIWSDETTVRSHPNSKEILFRCHSSVSLENLPVNPQVQAGGISVMFWGCFSMNGLGPLVALDGNQNQHSYIELLKNYLLPEIQEAKRSFEVDLTFMQDNAVPQDTISHRLFGPKSSQNTGLTSSVPRHERNRESLGLY